MTTVFLRGKKPLVAYAFAHRQRGQIGVCFEDPETKRRTWFFAPARVARELAAMIETEAAKLEQ